MLDNIAITLIRVPSFDLLLLNSNETRLPKRVDQLVYRVLLPTPQDIVLTSDDLQLPLGIISPTISFLMPFPIRFVGSLCRLQPWCFLEIPVELVAVARCNVRLDAEVKSDAVEVVEAVRHVVYSGSLFVSPVDVVGYLDVEVVVPFDDLAVRDLGVFRDLFSAVDAPGPLVIALDLNMLVVVHDPKRLHFLVFPASVSERDTVEIVDVMELAVCNVAVGDVREHALLVCFEPVSQGLFHGAAYRVQASCFPSERVFYDYGIVFCWYFGPWCFVVFVELEVVVGDPFAFDE